MQFLTRGKIIPVSHTPRHLLSTREVWTYPEVYIANLPEMRHFSMMKLMPWRSLMQTGVGRSAGKSGTFLRGSYWHSLPCRSAALKRQNTSFASSTSSSRSSIQWNATASFPKLQSFGDIAQKSSAIKTSFRENTRIASSTSSNVFRMSFSLFCKVKLSRNIGSLFISPSSSFRRCFSDCNVSNLSSSESLVYPMGGLLAYSST